jgi:hypothetical protein
MGSQMTSLSRTFGIGSLLLTILVPLRLAAQIFTPPYGEKDN